jgi:hypothetical protein
MRHELKSSPEFFEPTRLGLKKHDMRRRDDRNFSVDDTVVLREYDHSANKYTGRELEARITYITSKDNQCALSAKALDGLYCILSLELL